VHDQKLRRDEDITDINRQNRILTKE